MAIYALGLNANYTFDFSFYKLDIMKVLRIKIARWATASMLTSIYKLIISTFQNTKRILLQYKHGHQMEL